MLNKARILTLVLACLVVFGTLYQTYRFEQTLKLDAAREDAAIQQLHAIDHALADVRQAQAAYVAIGQGSAYWMSQFDEALARVEGPLRDLQQSTKATGALTHYDAALEQIEALRTSDRRARNYVVNEQRILASDVIFVESQEIIGRIAANVAAARDTEVFSARQSQATIDRYRQGLIAGGLLVTLFLMLVVPRKTVIVETVPEPAPVPETVPEPAPRPVTVASNLDETADVCVDLARLLDGRDLPALLSRAASAIDAKGLVLWVIDEQGQSLRATMGHGYSDKMLARLGTLQVSADNPTSLACRTLQPQIVPAATFDGSGALAVPLIGTHGCVGVLSAEVSGFRAHSQQVSTARLIAAQLSSVIRPDASATPSAIAQSGA